MRVIDGEMWHMTKEIKTWIDLDGIPWTKSKTTRRVESDKTRVIDLFRDGCNINHIETSSLQSEAEVKQFNRRWAKNWYRAQGY